MSGASLLGAFLVPVTFVTYLYGRLPDWEIPLPTLAVCFLRGEVLGTVVVGTLEYDLAKSLGFVPKLGIGLIEESAKLMPLVFYFLGSYHSAGWEDGCMTKVELLYFGGRSGYEKAERALRSALF